MNDDANGDGPSAHASPPCFMHEIDPDYWGLAEAADPRQRADVIRWRKAERERLIAARRGIPKPARRAHSRRIAEALAKAIGEVSGLTVSVYWPIRGEPDLRDFLEHVAAGDGRTALPVVMKRGQALVFRAWSKGQPMVRGVWNIPVPTADADPVVPDVVIAPVVGFDPKCYRLGYGGGYFDRTLAIMPGPVRIFGVGFRQGGIPTIYPQPHDIPMDAVVTEDGLLLPEPSESASLKKPS